MLHPPPSTIPIHSTVDCYLRDSGGPTQERSTHQQRNEIEKFCTEHGLNLRHVFSDEALSGGSTANRESFTAMLAIYERNEDDRPAGLLLWNYARFARDLDDSIYYKSLLKTQGITVHSLTDHVPEGHHGRIVELFIDISNEEKRRQTSEDAKRGLRDLVLGHGCVPGLPPRGFMRVPVNVGTRRDGSERIAHRWEPDPEKIELVQEAFKMKSAGASLSEIHKKTKLYGSLSSYRTFFNNPIYLGILHYGGQVIEDYCKPMIDIQTWKNVQKILDKHSQAQKNKAHPRRKNSPYTLSGIVKCAACGSPLNGNTVTRSRKRNEAYRCSRSKRRAGCNQKRIGRKTLEDAVIKLFKESILLPDNIAAIHEITQQNLAKYEKERAKRRKKNGNKRMGISKKIANITHAIAETGHSSALLDTLTQLEAERAELLKEAQELKEPIRTLPDLSKEEIEAQSAYLLEQIQTRHPQRSTGYL